jgi:thermostable 8-oxoguanine DNA glycosylase
MKRYKDLIKALPYSEQLGRSRRRTWSQKLEDNGKLAKTIVKLFGDNEEIEISREDLFDSAKNDELEIFLAKVFVWGYPRGARGDNYKKISMNISKVEQLLVTAQKSIVDWHSHYSSLSKIKGVGLSTYTKFLYFKGVKVHGLPALILDIRVINALKREIFTELKDISHIRNSNAYKYYLDYLSCMHKIAETLEVEPDSVELFLFQYGDALKIRG